MPINPDAVGSQGEPFVVTWDSKDCLLYAVGIGAGAADLPFSTENSRDAAGNIIPQLDGINLNQNTNASKGTGKADQTASLVGSIAVTVVDVLANGNLVVKGEKKLGLSEGTEVIQVTGIIRPEDVGPNSTVQSRRLANAQIAYRGAGDLANAARVGWGTSLMHRFWPF